MEKLVFKRKKEIVNYANGKYFKIGVGEATYKTVVAVAEETGLTLKEVIERMISYAYKNTVFESEEE